jgi:beta-galactosidase
VPDAASCAVDLPHSPFVADLDGNNHWFGECEYERSIARPAEAAGGPVTLYVGAAMHSAIVRVDGIECGRHAGGYLPFEVDLTDALSEGGSHRLTLRLENRDNLDVPPGKPYSELDFCWYGGLYRQVELRSYPPVHITDPVGAGVVAGGGVFVQTLAASPESATLEVRTHVRNASPAEQVFDLEVEILDGQRIAARGRCAARCVGAGAAETITTRIEVPRPRLWQPDTPHLHRTRVTLRDAAGRVLDVTEVRTGIRRISFSRSGGFVINGRRVRLRGTNRHQDYPRVGYAVSAAAQRRDARRIKEAGFDYVRLSHYPQSPDFLDACDELGLVVMNCIPGWQYVGGAAFREGCFENARVLIRRDRHHPCVVLWELCLNETRLDEPFLARLHKIGHEEYPGDQMFTCGWMDRYDVFIHSRQHGQLHSWRNGDKALVVAEYGDWEFYASTEGFDQKTGRGIYKAAGNSRKRRADGEAGLRQQAANHQLALNDTLGSPAVLDGVWSMFDYPRGYDQERATCGVMDIFRLPKFSHDFFRSQRDATENGEHWQGGPVVFIASHWTTSSSLTIPVFTNCDEVELRLNGTLIARRAPARDETTAHLPHPPCVFQLPAFSAGVLEATGYLAGKLATSHRIATPGPAWRVEVEIDLCGITGRADASDVLLAHARVLDRDGTLCVGETPLFTFSVDGGASIVGPSAVQAEAGIASVVLHLPPACSPFTLRCEGSLAGTAKAAACVWAPGSVVPLTSTSTSTTAAPILA